MPAKKQKRQSKKAKPMLVETPIKEPDKPKKPDETLFMPPYGAWSAES
jgi:hypothetical protein